MVYQDEVHFQVQTTITRSWYKKGSKPKIKSFPGSGKASYSGFVIPETGELFVTKPTVFNYETTIESIRAFLSARPAPEGKRYALVMDNAPWHKKSRRLIVDERLEEYSDILQSVEFIKLPPYSPDLNPIENEVKTEEVATEDASTEVSSEEVTDSATEVTTEVVEVVTLVATSEATENKEGR